MIREKKDLLFSCKYGSKQGCGNILIRVFNYYLKDVNLGVLGVCYLVTHSVHVHT